MVGSTVSAIVKLSTLIGFPGSGLVNNILDLGKMEGGYIMNMVDIFEKKRNYWIELDNVLRLVDKTKKVKNN